MAYTTITTVPIDDQMRQGLAPSTVIHDKETPSLVITTA
jgi:hypothetical protein